MIRWRDADLRDVPGNTERKFVYSSWLSSFHKSHSQGLIDAHSWYRVMIEQLDIVTSRPGVRTIVAHEPDDDAIAGLYGFLCAEPDSDPPFVYYCFTKDPYRKMGLARGMFKAAGINPRSRFEYGCRTAVVVKLLEFNKIPLARWNPIGANYARDQRRSVYE